MKVFGYISFKDVKNIMFSVAMICICLVNTEVYADKSVKMNSFSVPSGIEEIYRNINSTKYKLKTSYDIYKITDQNGGNITPDRIDGNTVLFTSSGLTKVRVYWTKTKYEIVDLENAIQDEIPPQILWQYKDANDNIVWFEAQDEAGLYEIRSASEGNQLRTVFTDMRKSAIISIEAENIDDLLISDVFGNVKKINLSNTTLEVTKAIKNVNGDRFIIKLIDWTTPITGLEYADGRGQIGEELSTYSFEKVYNVYPGTTKVKVNFGDEYAIVQLDTDSTLPEILRVWRKKDSSKMLIETKDDQSGIWKYSYYNRDTKDEHKCDEFYDYKGGKVKSYDVDEGVTHVYVYDGLGNRTTLCLETIAIDDEAPLVKIKYKDGEYEVIVQDEKSGINEVKLDGNDIDIYENYPVEEFRYTYLYDDIDGDSHVVASDGVGNKMDLTVNEIVSVRKRFYKNSKGDIISISIEDDRGIKKITDQDGKIIERMWLNEKEVNGLYKVRKNIDSIKVFYESDKSYDVKLQELTATPEVSNKVCDNAGCVTECVVSSKAGIRKIEYRDGRSIIFKVDMPDDITVNCTRLDNGVEIPTVVTVYDALGNSVKINEN